MTPEQISFLKSPVAGDLLAALQVDESTHFQLASDLRKRFSQTEVHALLETATLRQRARSKFSQADQMLFSRAALEQSSGEIISAYRAGRFAGLNAGRMVDIGCGIGGDSLGLAAVGEVIGLDLDFSRLQMAVYNLAVNGHGDRFCGIQTDVTYFSPMPADGLFFDPARRTESGKRIFSIKGYKPSLAVIDRWMPKIKGAGVKISPGVDYAELPDADVAKVEFISVRGNLKEAVLWYKALKDQLPADRVATLLPGGAQLGSNPRIVPAPLSQPLSYLYEPDDAVIRAHLIAELANQLSAFQIDASIAYLTADHALDTPFARRFEVLDTFRFSLKQIKRYLTEHRVGRLTVKKRGSPIEPDQFLKKLKLKGDQARILFLTKVAGEPSVIICRDKSV